jgi:hypothetical protein
MSRLQLRIAILIRRARRAVDVLERTYSICLRPGQDELASTAGLCWMIETWFEMAEDELGPDYCEARSAHAWRRHIVMTAFSFARLRYGASTVTPALRPLTAELGLTPKRSPPSDREALVCTALLTRSRISQNRRSPSPTCAKEN